MDVTLVVMRLLHVGLGVFWVGTMVFNAVFLGPSVRDAGPDGAKVMAGLMRRRFMDVMPVVAILNILSGLWLYWKVSGGFQPAYMRSGTGMTFGTGALLAVVAFVIGMAVVRPSMLKAMAMGPLIAQAQPQEKETMMAQAQGYRSKAMGAGKVVALLLGLAAAAMAVARYV
jgi:uncharacterized membrane protein